VITLLGNITDTLRGELRLPEDKLQRQLRTVTKWEKCKVCTCRKLESPIGDLQHAARVIKPGRSFLGQVISLLSVAKQRHDHIRLNAEFRSDMMICYTLEWCIPHNPSRKQEDSDYIRCLRFTGMWSVA